MTCDSVGIFFEIRFIATKDEKNSIIVIFTLMPLTRGSCEKHAWIKNNSSKWIPLPLPQHHNHRLSRMRRSRLRSLRSAVRRRNSSTERSYFKKQQNRTSSIRSRHLIYYLVDKTYWTMTVDTGGSWWRWWRRILRQSRSFVIARRRHRIKQRL